MAKYIFPGTFDPITFGHISVLKKFLTYILPSDLVTIGVSLSKMKKPFLSFDERFELTNEIISRIFSKIPDIVSVEKIIGNTAHFIHDNEYICFRGIRNIIDLKYESYWPVSRSSNAPVDVFYLIPILEKEEQRISSTLFRDSFDRIANSKNPVFDELNHIAPYESTEFFIRRYKELNLLDKNFTFNLFESSEYFSGIPSYKVGALVLDCNIIDNGHIASIKNVLNLVDKLILIIPEKMEYERVPFSVRNDLISSVINKSFSNEKIKLVTCPDLNNISDFTKLLQQENVNELFVEMREYHTRSDERLQNAFDMIKALDESCINSMIVLQEKFRDIAQPLILNTSYDESNFYISREKSLLRKYLPEDSIAVVMGFARGLFD